MSTQPSSPLASPAASPVNDAVKRDAARFIVGVALSGLAGGSLFRAIPGVKETFFPTKPLPQRGRSFRPVPLSIDGDEEKQAEGVFDDYVMSPATEAVKNLLPDNWFGGNQATTAMGVPAALGIGVPAAFLGAYGGYHLTDAALDARRKAEQKAELAEAKRKYEALLTQGKVAAVLDDLANDACQKQADTPVAPQGGGFAKAPIHNTLGMTAGGYAALAILSALAAGAGTYGATRARSRRGVLEDAMRERTRSTAAVPLPFHVYPTGAYPPK